jgi:hypothetical protein
MVDDECGIIIDDLISLNKMLIEFVYERFL